MRQRGMEKIRLKTTEKTEYVNRSRELKNFHLFIDILACDVFVSLFSEKSFTEIQ